MLLGSLVRLKLAIYVGFKKKINYYINYAFFVLLYT